MGPTSYHPSFRLAEKRADIGIKKIREPYFAIDEEDEGIEDDRPELHPNFDFDKPNKGGFKYHKPLEGLQPEHTPDKLLYPERWRYYDYDLDVVREEVAKEIAFAGNLSLQRFREKEEFHEMLVEHLARKEKRPDIGQYDPQIMDTKFEVDFSKAVGREPYYDEVNFSYK